MFVSKGLSLRDGARAIVVSITLCSLVACGGGKSNGAGHSETPSSSPATSAASSSITSYASSATSTVTSSAASSVSSAVSSSVASSFSSSATSIVSNSVASTISSAASVASSAGSISMSSRSSVISSASSLSSASSAASISSALSSSSAGPSLLSKNAAAVASTQEGTLKPGFAVDGVTASRWASQFSDAEWIYIDLGASSDISRVVLNWEGAYGKAYNIQVSVDAANWTSIYSTTNSDGGLDDLSLTGTGRYVRMQGVTRATQWGYSLWEFEVYGVRNGPVASSSSSSSSLAAANSVFGPNVLVFDSSMDKASIQAQVNAVFDIEQYNQFDAPRHALLFKPGTYDIDIPVGFFTHVIGLGAFPDEVKIASVRSEAVLPGNNATQNFWRGVENFAVSQDDVMRWGVSQAVPFRRMHILHKGIRLSADYGWSSGGWMADSQIDGAVDCWAQQQWASRNSQWNSWGGNLWNMVFVGIPNNLPTGTWPTAAHTFVDKTPVIREKPFLYLNGANYEVFVPALRTDSAGISWANNQQAGTSISLDQFYVAKAGTDTATTINTALSQGKHLLLTPGIYDLDDTLKVTQANTIVLGMGFATLHPTNGKTALSVADVDGVTVAHLLIDAGETNSPTLLEVGAQGSNANHASNPTEVIDVFIRIGGNGVAKATVAMQVNSNNVIIDHTWIWRADHGEGAGWSSNTSRNGLVVNGNNVMAYGLFVEHFQEYQVLWNGENGRTYFYQSEIPYDPPSQAAYTSGTGVNGWASYKVADNVTNHEAWGLGIYSVFTNANVNLSHAIEVPDTPNVKFHHAVTVNLTENGSIQNVINSTGGATAPGIAKSTPRVTDYPAP